MDTKDKISDDYRKQVDKLLDNKSGNNLFVALNQEELDEIWEEISTEADIIDVWDNISSDLDIPMPEDSGSGIVLKSVAAVLIILVGMIPVKKAIQDSVISQPDIMIETRQNDQQINNIILNKQVDSDTGEQGRGVISPSSKSSLDKSEDVFKTNTAESDRADLAQGTPMPLSTEVVSTILTVSEMADSNMVVSADKIPIEKSGIPPAIFPGDLKTMNIVSQTDFDHLQLNINSSAARSSLTLSERGRISGGLITLFKNTWLLNYETFDGFKSESLNTTEFVYYPDVGLSLIYSLNKIWQVQADGFFFSNTGQEYLGYYNGHYSRKEINLRYSTIALSVKRKFIIGSNLSPRSSINVLAGGYLAFLNYANQRINTEMQNVGSQYGNCDLGIRLGYEFELKIFDQLSVAPGLFLSLGMPNIYKGDSYIPGYLKRTHNGSAEFHLAFYYHFD